MSLIDLLKRKNKKVLFTTPSHGQSFFVVNKFRHFYKYYISETDAHDPQAALALAEERAAMIYGSKYTKFLTNGSSSGIIAAVLACVKQGDKVFIWENAHPCHKNAVELAGGIPVFYELPFIDDWGIYGSVDIEKIKSSLISEKPVAIIVTSPSYEGIVSNVSLISEL